MAEKELKTLSIRINIDGSTKIKGEFGRSTEEHADDIGLLSFSWSLDQLKDPTPEGTRAKGKGGLMSREISFEKRTDCASALLLQHCAMGTDIESAVLTHHTAADEDPVYIITMANVIISHVSHVANDLSEPQEHFTLRFLKFHFQRGDIGYGWDCHAESEWSP